MATFITAAWTAFVLYCYVIFLMWLFAWMWHFTKLAGKASLQGFAKAKDYFRNRRLCKKIDISEDNLFDGITLDGEVIWKS